MSDSNSTYTCACQSCPKCLLATSAALFGLRDALVELSLALQDWRFEVDRPQRERATIMVCDVLMRVKANSAHTPITRDGPLRPHDKAE
jgi:hypothetical protein